MTMMTIWGCEEETMKENRVITIDKEGFDAMALEVLCELVDNDEIAMSVISAMTFPRLKMKLFYTEKESEEKGHE